MLDLRPFKKLLIPSAASEMKTLAAVLVLALVALVNADMYFHNPRLVGEEAGYSVLQQLEWKCSAAAGVGLYSIIDNNTHAR